MQNNNRTVQTVSNTPVPEKAAFTIFLNHMIGKRILTQDGRVLGRLTDLSADPDSVRPKILGAVISVNGREETIDFSELEIQAEGKNVRLYCREPKPMQLESADSVCLVRQLENSRVVDMNKKKTVTVNDLKLAVYPGEASVAAVDVGILGRLRSLGIAEPVVAVLRMFGVTLPNQLILWDNIEAINFGRRDPLFARSRTKLDRLHPSDMADIIEGLDTETQADIFSALETERAADVLEELEADARGNLMELLSTEKMADVLERMPADEAADVLDELNEVKAEKLLLEMEKTASVKVRGLLEYEDFEVGSLMATDPVCFLETAVVKDTLEELRRLKPEPDMIYSLYVVSSQGVLEAEVSLGDFVTADPEAKLGDIMNRNISFVFDTDRIDTLDELITKYDLLSVPVVDEEHRLIGMVIIHDVIDTLLHSKRKSH